MKRKYEAMIVLDMKGKEETVEQLIAGINVSPASVFNGLPYVKSGKLRAIAGISRDFEKSGAKLEQIDHLGKRQFPFSPRHVTSGYFVNFQIEADNTALDSMRAKLKLNENVYQQYYQRIVA